MPVVILAVFLLDLRQVAPLDIFLHDAELATQRQLVVKEFREHRQHLRVQFLALLRGVTLVFFLGVIFGRVPRHGRK